MRFLWFFAAFFSALSLAAQETPEKEDPSGTGIFPLALVLEAAEYAGDGNRGWRPDWPPELPPDAFKVRSGEVSRVSLEGEGFSFVYRIDSAGRVVEFPFWYGAMAQVSVVYNERAEISTAEISAMDLNFQPGEREDETAGDAEASAGEPWKLEFLEYMDSYPVRVRASRGDAWYFIALSRAGYEIAETWYDESGDAVEAYGFSLIEIDKKLKIRKVREHSKPELGSGTERHYDSRGFITQTADPGGLYNVLYFRDDLPRYWERRPVDDVTAAGGGAGRFTFQWDDNDFLVRLTFRAFTEFSALSGANEIDNRYEYTLDEKGNWIERREITMLRAFGLLVPRPGAAVKRILEYSEQK